MDNLSCVFYALMNSDGYAGSHRSCAGFSLKGFSKKAFYSHASYLYNQMRIFFGMKQREVVEAVRQYYVNSEGRDDDGLLDIEVSFDGTWMTRGHKSHLGIGLIVECNTGLAIDFEVISNYCQRCNAYEKRLSADEFAEWKRLRHARCMKNFDGKAGAFEKEAAVRLWGRSTQLGLRYVTFLSDGNSNAYKAVCEMNDGHGPYDVNVEKEDCINHVAKRLGSRLRALKNKSKVVTTTKAGKQVMKSMYAGAGKLTDGVIDLLTRHFGQNLRKHNSSADVATVRESILATYYHSSSTDARPRHASCPHGAQSWCWVQRAEAANKTPEPHSTKSLHLAGMSQELLKGILQVYVDLCSDQLLKRCVKQRTQNSNESLHSKIWPRCSKEKFASLDRVLFVARGTVLDHNIGYEKGNLLVALGLRTPDHLNMLKVKAAEVTTPSRKPRKTRAATPSTGYGAGNF
ncbi:hypothetical protein HAZT_HAZT005313 [Hyalella azteca]|uniref:Mutator-like transposase domain-containing protein n=1 Tax=Hyalella azteca TaxID=294128 RepID=A0A6A0H1Z7_HYAAZ|nr:hypothetical protein HAZT_HAZT005313 [Hyalella azteca]